MDAAEETDDETVCVRASHPSTDDGRSARTAMARRLDAKDDVQEEPRVGDDGNDVRTMAKTLAVVIPTWEEGKNVETAMRSVKDGIVGMGVQNIVVVDASVGCETSLAAKQSGANHVLVKQPKGRGAQMNRGAKMCEQDVILFLHADCVLPKGYDESIRRALHNGQAWGAFESLDIQGKRWPLRWVEMGVKWRTKVFGSPYGDQGIFVRRDAFQNMGGYQEPTFLEDLELTQRLRRKHGKPSLVKEPMATSARRWNQVGVLKSVLINQCILAAYAAGVPAKELESWYRDPRRLRPGKTLHGMGNLLGLAATAWATKLHPAFRTKTTALGRIRIGAGGKPLPLNLES